MRNLRDTLASANESMKTLEGAIADARPGLQTFSDKTIPEANALIRDLRRTSASLSSLTDKLDQQGAGAVLRSEEHTSELQSLMRSSYAVFCLKKKKTTTQTQ